MSEDDLLRRVGEAIPAEYPYLGCVIKRNTGCRYCYSESCLFVLNDAKWPHSYGLRCKDCDRHVGWLTKAEAAALPAGLLPEEIGL